MRAGEKGKERIQDMRAEERTGHVDRRDRAGEDRAGERGPDRTIERTEEG